jgi:transposase
VEYTSKNIDHLGIVAGVCKEIGLVQEIDNLVGINEKQIVTTGEAVTAMVINALGFVNRPLYLFPEFMRNKPTELFFREDLKPEDFNEDTIGRSLERIFVNNPTKIFMHIALKTADMLGIVRRFLHLDTTTMSVHGEYKFEDIDQVPIAITHGFSKDKRFDLKQFVISLITSSQSDFPVWMDVLSGNSSDKTHFRDVIKRFSKELSKQDEATYFVMDSAMYTEENVKEISPLVKWISRVPETISEAKKLIEETGIGRMSESIIDGYSYKEYTNSYGGVEQKWLVIFSEKGYDREIKTLNKNIKKEKEKIEKQLWHFMNNEFNCQEDGISELNNLIAKWKYHKINEFSVAEVNKTGKRGRPKNDMQSLKKVYKIKTEFENDETKMELERAKKGKFIVATNDLKLDNNEALKEYKGQQSVERGFRFLKDPLFFASSVFLKKPERIVSLGMVMVLSLLVYSVAQLKLRKALSERNETIPDQKGKPTANPTMRRVFQIFEGISLLIESKDGNGKIVGMMNLREIHRKILALLGASYEKMYLC